MRRTIVYRFNERGERVELRPWWKLTPLEALILFAFAFAVGFCL